LPDFPACEIGVAITLDEYQARRAQIIAST